MTARALLFAALLLAALLLAAARAQQEDATTPRELRVRQRQLARRELKIWGRSLAEDPCRDNQDTCFDLSGCMLCKAYSNPINGDGHIQCLTAAGNEHLYNGEQFDGCCATEEGGASGTGEVCSFWENLTPDELK